MNVVDMAKSLVGKVSYKFGATDVAGGKGDCSSFTQYIYSLAGVDIGRTTNDQWQTGEKVSLSEIQPGDLVFFKNTWTSGYKDGVSHVGIYIGNGQFVHNSSGAGETVISSLSEDYYAKHYLGARRVTGSTETEDGSLINLGLKDKITEKVTDSVTDIAAGVLKAVVILVLLVLAFLSLTQGFGFKIGG